MDKPESFEKTDYGDAHEGYDRLSVISQIVTEKVRENPAYGITAGFAGNTLTLKYSVYEMHLPSRMKVVEAAANDCLREMLSYLKKEFRKRTKKSLDLKELKERASHSVQKVSLNERYVACFWRVYEMS